MKNYKMSTKLPPKGISTEQRVQFISNCILRGVIDKDKDAIRSWLEELNEVIIQEKLI